MVTPNHFSRAYPRLSVNGKLLDTGASEQFTLRTGGFIWRNRTCGWCRQLRFYEQFLRSGMEAAKGNRYGHRDATMVLLAFRHGLRASEVCDLRWDQVDFNGAVLHVRRVKNGTPSTHPIQGDELRALRRLQRESPTSPFVFVSERGSPFTTAGFARMIERAAAGADLEIKPHPHMLRHACGYALANQWA
jgi:integrase